MGGAGASSGGACAQWSMGGSFPGKKTTSIPQHFCIFRFCNLDFLD